MAVELYGERFRNPFLAEITAIQRGGHWWNQFDDGTYSEDCGLGLFEHYKNLQSLIWPWKGWDRWSCQILGSLITNKLTLLAGPNSSAKTHNVAAFVVCRYIAFPTDSCALVSSTDSRSLELRIWGEIKKLWNEAKIRFPDTPGRIIESKQCIITDIEDNEATDYRNGIIGVPCMVGGNFQGLGRYAGIKNGKVFLAADELQFMPTAFYDGMMAMTKNPEFKAAGLGNPKDRTDTFGRLYEPAASVGGWEAYEPTGKTYSFPTRFPGGLAIQLDGRDTPNNDPVPCKEGEKWPYPYLINRDQIAEDVAFHGAEDWHVFMNDYGIFPRDAQSKRIITRLLCERFRAFEEPLWSGDDLVKQFTIDAAYGAVGGDRCIGIETCWGPCTDGKIRLASVGNPQVIPVKASVAIPAEEQIAQWVKEYCEAKGIPPSHVGFDSTGRGSLVSAFGRVGVNPGNERSPWDGTQVVAIEFGGVASERPVSAKIRVPAREYYFNFVSEMWFALPTLIESDQCRALPTSVMEEAVMRGWLHRNRRIQVETKEDYKVRLTRSPDISDSYIVAIELARRLGFQLGNAGAESSGSSRNWLDREIEAQMKLKRAHQLVYR